MVKGNIFMLKILSVFVNKCKAARRYGEDSCLFNAKCVLGLFFTLNFLTVLFFLFKRVDLLKLIPSDKKTYMVMAFGFMALIFTILTIAYPKRKILAVQMEKQVQQRIFTGIIFYIILSVVLFSISIYTAR